MADYKRQLVLRFLTGGPDDEVIRNMADAIGAKAKLSGLKTSKFTVPILNEGQTPKNDKRFSEMLGELGKLNNESRLYLVGHGNWKSQTLGGRTANSVAGLLGGGRINGVKVISILGCSLGADSDSADNVRISNSANSFASNFHLMLGVGHGLYAEVTARIWNVGLVLMKNVHNDRFEWEEEDIGRKITVNNGIVNHHASQSKLRFFWQDGRQQRQWAY